MSTSVYHSTSFANSLPKLPGNPPFQLKMSHPKEQLFALKYGTCIEKPKFSNIKFNDTDRNLKEKIEEDLKASYSAISNLRKDVRSVSLSNESFPRILPQWIKQDRKVLKFIAYFNEAINESNVENYRIRACHLYYYLDDDTTQVFELRSENSGIPQGTIVKRHRIKKGDKEFLHYNDLSVGGEVSIYGKVFRICNCDKFTRDFYKDLGVELNQPEDLPEFINSQEIVKYKVLGDEENKKNIAEFKNFCEVKLGGGRANRLIKTFLENDRKVLAFDIIWYDEQDKEEKQYKMHYYLSDSQIEIREVKMNNSGKDDYPYLVKKGKLPKKPYFSFCPGLGKRDEEFYKPEDLRTGIYINIYNRNCFIYDCDEFTKSWYREK